MTLHAASSRLRRSRLFCATPARRCPASRDDVRLRVAAEAAALPPLSAAVGRLLPPRHTSLKSSVSNPRHPQISFLCHVSCPHD